ncbi:hypothetical protein EZH22_09555 [Xanthobacter dioxanivorans]|uniref:Uncharacterized protein n=1 Tax=Xanthobacter dioxanivorans TaxID=2528964 RepID=A0A974PRP0_9HYPH|nr:hypothetical protein [Xanthobacter dioxanivorans]QRG08503.1 hypothetical protein EZH22_09555 [Xanthobacter dioxanivorans]
MKKIAVVTGALLLAGAGGALAQTPSITLTCGQAADLVRTRGEALLATSRTLYDRYVRDRSFCVYDQDTRPEWVPTRDNPQCFIGYTCFEPSRGGGRSP